MRSTLALFLGALVMVTGSSCDSPIFNRNDPARIHRNAGIQAFKKEEWGKAADEWAKSLAAKPNQPELYEKQAYAAARAGRLDEAAETLKKTLAFKTGDPEKEKLEVTRKIANMYLQNGRLDKAEQNFLEILKKVPEDETSIIWLGEIHSSLGGARRGQDPADLMHLEKAIVYYDRALEINPENVTPWVNKRIALFKTQHYWNNLRIAAEKDEAELPRREKAKKADARKRMEEAQAKLDELTPRIEEVSARLSEVLKRRKAAANDGGTSGDEGGDEGGEDAGTPADGAADAG